jgi:repressor of nif and glnA expression
MKKKIPKSNPLSKIYSHVTVVSPIVVQDGITRKLTEKELEEMKKPAKKRKKPLTLEELVEHFEDATWDQAKAGDYLVNKSDIDETEKKYKEAKEALLERIKRVLAERKQLRTALRIHTTEPKRTPLFPEDE